MCFFLAAPTRTIRVHYVSEFIRFLRDGSSECTVDVLLEDISDIPPDPINPVDKLFLIYPNRFFDLDNTGAFTSGEFSDETSTFLNRLSHWNWIYQTGGSSLREGKRRENEADGTPLVVQIPDPKQPSSDNPTELRGQIIGECTLSRYKFEHREMYKILKSIPITMFVASLDTPLQHKQKRWFRWYFHAETSSINKHTKWERLKRWVGNNRYYMYEIQGPYNCLEKLREFLKTSMMVSGRKEAGVTSDIGGRGVRAYNELYEIFFGSLLGANGTQTIFDNWWIHVDANNVGIRLTDIVMLGNIEAAGGLPNAKTINNRTKLIYEWKAGYYKNSTKNISDKKPDNSTYLFSLFFQAKPSVRLIVLLPWFVLLILLIDMAYRFFD